MGDFSDCIGWFPGLLITPAPGGDGTDDRLGTGMDMDVLDGDALLTLAAVTVEGFGQSRVGSRELGRLFQVLMPTVESLVPKHRMPVTLRGGVMARDQLRDQHSLDLVARLYANNSGERRLCLTPPLIEIVGLTPQNISDLINEEVGEIGTVGAADRLLSGGGNFADYYLCPRRRSFSRRCGSLGRSRSGARAINWFSL
jgi:hypothetical protein